MGKKWEPASAVWARYMALTCAFALLNGGIYSLFPKYAYPTFSIIVPSILPRSLFAPLSIPGLIGTIASVIITFLETDCCDMAKSLNGMLGYFPKALLFLILAVVTVNQLTLVPAATFCVGCAFMWAIAGCQREPNDGKILRT